MDELLIGEKRYVSSKRAAHLTGYAKDYVGQLCREGRVPARLVGRSWYVLESAIQDHRFGTPEASDAKEEPKQAVKEEKQSTWEEPRYEAGSADEVLPTVNLLHKEPEEEVDPHTQSLQDSWQAWFSRIGEPASEEVRSPEAEREIEEESEVEVPGEAPAEEVEVKIKAIHHSLPPEHMFPRTSEEEVSIVEAPVRHVEARRGRSSRGVAVLVRTVCTLVALIAIITAVAGSGYIDQYLVSNEQVRLIGGVSLYNK